MRQQAVVGKASTEVELGSAGGNSEAHLLWPSAALSRPSLWPMKQMTEAIDAGTEGDDTVAAPVTNVSGEADDMDGAPHAIIAC